MSRVKFEENKDDNTQRSSSQQAAGHTNEH